MKCREHDWRYGDGRWVCGRCGEWAAAMDPAVDPCPRCGAIADPKLIYCDLCLERLYRLGIDDG